LLSIPCSQVQFDHNLLNLQSPDTPAVRLQRKLIQAGAPSVLYCAVVADSLPQAVQWEERIRQLSSVGRVMSLATYLSEDQEGKLALVREIKGEVGGLGLPEWDRGWVSLPDLTRRLALLHAYLGRVTAVSGSGPASAGRPCGR
jgi:hypothetical protein